MSSLKKLLPALKNVLVLLLVAALSSYATLVAVAMQQSKNGPSPGCVIGYQGVMTPAGQPLMIPVELCPQNPKIPT